MLHNTAAPASLGSLCPSPFSRILAFLLLSCAVYLALFRESLGSSSCAPAEKGIHEVGLFPHEIPRARAGPSVRPSPAAPAASAALASSAPAGAATAGYSQPASKAQLWFDIKQQGGFKQVPLLTAPLAVPPASQRHPQWIVVTTINAPTPTIEKLATLSEWRVVVVGDTKTPKGYAYPNITYLSVDAQLALGFSTTQLLRTRSYQRKNIGYLYAIQHGARVIYETDDDNALQVEAVPVIPTLTPSTSLASVLEYASPELTINHHAHFQQPSTWPRGYPLEAIGDPHATSLRLAPLIPAVQQGLANGDPDMDAVFRLTRKPRDVRIDFAFAQAPPVALPMGAFGPFNAQNTLFTYQGLWATLLPQSVEFRVCDIWRAYFVQRLLWGTGAQLAFVAPYVYQLRNSHSYHEDYVSEKQIYDQVTALLHFLRQWRCGAEDVRAFPPPPAAAAAGSASLLPQCAYALARDLAVGGFWGQADAELVRHFFQDLARVGYAFPLWLEAVEEGGGGQQQEEEEDELAAAALRELGPWPRPCDTQAALGLQACKGGAGKPATEPVMALPSTVLEGTCPA